MNYKHLNYEERIKIDTLVKEGLSLRKIAKSLSRSPNTVSRELKEKKVKNEYIPKKAQHKSYWRRYRSKMNCMKVAVSKEMNEFVSNKIKDNWSPERISGYLKLNNISVSKKAIYKFIHSRCLERYLFKRRISKNSRKRFKKLDDNRRYIEQRAPIVCSGHYEADFIVSSKSKSCLLVIVDKHSRHTMSPLPNSPKPIKKTIPQ